MSALIVYNVSLATASEILAHLLHASEDSEPSLSCRVDVLAYANKLHDRAVRFEAWLGDDLVGLVASYCNHPERTIAFVSNVSVWSGFRGNGIATRLMRQCIEYAQTLGFANIELEVDQSNAPALALYQKLGFNTLRSNGSSLTMGLTLTRTSK